GQYDTTASWNVAIYCSRSLSLCRQRNAKREVTSRRLITQAVRRTSLLTRPVQMALSGRRWRLPDARPLPYPNRRPSQLATPRRPTPSETGTPARSLSYLPDGNRPEYCLAGSRELTQWLSGRVLPQERRSRPPPIMSATASRSGG